MPASWATSRRLAPSRPRALAMRQSASAISWRTASWSTRLGKTTPSFQVKCTGMVRLVGSNTTDLEGGSVQLASPLRLRPPRFKADPRARTWWTVQALVVFSGPALLTALALLVLSALFFPGALPWLAPLTALVLVLPGLAYLVAMPRLRYRAHAWELGTGAVYSASGWFWRKHRIAPLSRVQTVDTVRGPIQQAFGLATVTV